jgi:DNA-directed RNA polymerase specialized sigma subunit
MADITQQQVIEAAQKLGKDEFNRQDIATALGVEKSDVKQAFTQARKDGFFEKVRDDEENTGIFKLGAKAQGGGAAPEGSAEGTVGQQV